MSAMTRRAPSFFASMAERMLASSALVSGDEDVGVVDVLLEQQVLVGGVAGQDQRVAQRLCRAARLCRGCALSA